MGTTRVFLGGSGRGFGGAKWAAVLAALFAALAVLMAVAPRVAWAPPTLPAICQQSGGQVVCTFNYTGAAQSWTVPDEVSQATFDVFGAQGGGSEPGFVGGRGGKVTATISVTPARRCRSTSGARASAAIATQAALLAASAAASAPAAEAAPPMCARAPSSLKTGS